MENKHKNDPIIIIGVILFIIWALWQLHEVITGVFQAFDPRYM